MEEQTNPSFVSTDRPRVALMGEFSAGKSTLANLLLEHESSRVQVTATQLPPVWYSHGPNTATRVTNAGAHEPMPFDDWNANDIEDTQLIAVGLETEILQSIDLIDMPGTSDPNLAVQYWKTVLPQVDLVIWCTPANQAWRQSEAALWDEVDPDLRARSLLLITRIDKIRSDEDKARIVKRVTHEAGSKFSAVLPISLTQALAAPANEEVLEASGAAAMVRFLIDATGQIAPRERPGFVPADVESNTDDVDETPAAPENAPEKPTVVPIRPNVTGTVVPRRIVRKPSSETSLRARPRQERPVP